MRQRSTARGAWPARKQPPAGARKHILRAVVLRPRLVIADDNDDILVCVCRLLTPLFDVVATASDGRTAYEAIVALRPDAVILDISMPVMTGIEVAERLSALPDP